MSIFNDIITAEEGQLLQTFYRFKDDPTPLSERLSTISKTLKLHSDQLICAIGFNPSAKYLTEIFPLLGYATFNELCTDRNETFSTDIYRRISLDNVLKIYDSVRDDQEMLQTMQYLLKNRLDKIEERIEATVNSLIIEKYKAEMRAIYNDGVASMEFVEERLQQHNSGFRALLNEVSIIVESKMIPAGDIFFRDSILPQEKSKLLRKGLIPKELVESRLNDERTPPDEKKILYDYLKSQRDT